jgi:hypothetical protein
MNYTHLFRSGFVLVTSRYSLTEARDDGRRIFLKTSIALAPFSAEEADRFLRKLTFGSGADERVTANFKKS